MRTSRCSGHSSASMSSSERHVTTPGDAVWEATDRTPSETRMRSPVLKDMDAADDQRGTLSVARDNLQTEKGAGMNRKSHLTGVVGLGLAGLIVVGSAGGLGAQVAGSTTIGISVEEMKAVAIGWSAKK